MLTELRDMCVALGLCKAGTKVASLPFTYGKELKEDLKLIFLSMPRQQEIELIVQCEVEKYRSELTKEKVRKKNV